MKKIIILILTVFTISTNNSFCMLSKEIKPKEEDKLLIDNTKNTGYCPIAFIRTCPNPLRNYHPRMHKPEVNHSLEDQKKIFQSTTHTNTLNLRGVLKGQNSWVTEIAQHEEK